MSLEGLIPHSTDDTDLKTRNNKGRCRSFDYAAHGSAVSLSAQDDTF